MSGEPQRKRTRLTRIALGLLIFCTVLLFAVVAYVMVLPDAVANLPQNAWQVRKSDVIIVLGTPATSNGTAGPVLRERIDKGVQLLKDGMADHIVFTGGAAHNQFVEARVMADRALSEGVSPDKILLEPQAMNTCQNAFFSVELMRKSYWKSAIVVSSQAHLRRAGYIFAHFPIDFCLAGCPNPPEQEAWKAAQFELTERLNIVRMVASGRAFCVDLTPEQAAAARLQESRSQPLSAPPEGVRPK